MQVKNETIQKCRALAHKLIIYYDDGFPDAAANRLLVADWASVLENNSFDLSEAERIHQRMVALSESNPPDLHDGSAWIEMCIFIRFWYKELNGQSTNHSESQ